MHQVSRTWGHQVSHTWEHQVSRTLLELEDILGHQVGVIHTFGLEDILEQV